MDRIEEWQTFVAVAGHRSFVAAARALGRSPQAVTRAVAALEKRLQTRLLARTTRSVSVTGDGERYLERGRRALAELEALETPVDESAPLRGVVSVTAPVLFGQLHVMPIVSELLTAHAGLDVRLVLLDRVVSLVDEAVDVAIRITSLPDSSLRTRVVGHVRTVVCASPAYLERAGKPRTPDALGDHACIASQTTPIADRWSFSKDGARDRATQVRARLITNSGRAAIDAALSGLGIVRALSYQVDELVAAGELVVVLRSYEPAPVPVQIVQLGGASSRAATAFIELADVRLRAKLALSRSR